MKKEVKSVTAKTSKAKETPKAVEAPKAPPVVEAPKAAKKEKAPKPEPAPEPPKVVKAVSQVPKPSQQGVAKTRVFLVTNINAENREGYTLEVCASEEQARDWADFHQSADGAKWSPVKLTPKNGKQGRILAIWHESTENETMQLESWFLS